jgi:hypothetical protein
MTRHNAHEAPPNRGAVEVDSTGPYSPGSFSSVDEASTETSSIAKTPAPVVAVGLTPFAQFGSGRGKSLASIF